MSIALRALLFVLFTLSANLWATPWYSLDVNKKATLNVELYLSSTCAYCQKADAFFHDIEPQAPWLHVQRYLINDDQKALLTFNQRLIEQNTYDFSVPAVFFCNSRWVGFESAETTGKDLLRALNYCKQQIESSGSLTQSTVNVLQRWSSANFLDTGFIGQSSAIQHITLVALIDAYNPCALFCIAGFFAFLFLLETRKKQWIIGLLFALAVGITHYSQQVYTNAFYELLPWLRLPAILVGGFALYVLNQLYRKKTVPDSFYVLAFLLALLLQVYQQTCVMNWSYIFQQWLNNQQVHPIQVGFMQLAYQAIYLLQLIILLALYSLISKMKFFARFKQKLKTVGFVWIIGLAAILIVYPYVLADFMLSLAFLVLLFICGIFLSRLYIFKFIEYNE